MRFLEFAGNIVLINCLFKYKFWIYVFTIRKPSLKKIKIVFENSSPHMIVASSVLARSSFFFGFVFELRWIHTHTHPKSNATGSVYVMSGRVERNGKRKYHEEIPFKKCYSKLDVERTGRTREYLFRRKCFLLL